MQDQSDTRTSPASRMTVRDELFGAPRPTGRARFSAVVFGLLLVVSLVLPVLTETPALPGLSLVAAGMMLLLGFAELMDARMRRLVVAVRCGGVVMALVGLAIQVVPAVG